MVLSEDKVIAPSLFVSENANAAWKYATHGYIAKEDCLRLLKAVLNEVDESVSDGELFPESLTEAVSRKHSVYDMLYFVLARRTSAPLLTCDRRLAALCRDGAWSVSRLLRWVKLDGHD